jgi:cytochrome c-type biogenesis protein CcmH
MSARRRSIGWVGVLTAIVVALTIALVGERDERNNAERAFAVANQLACPVCEGQSVAESDSAAAQAIRADINTRIDQGQTDEQITSALIASYQETLGLSISLKPKATGLVGLVWITPVVAFVTAVAGLVVVFRRWRRADVEAATDADRVLVARARAKYAPKATP